MFITCTQITTFLFSLKFEAGKSSFLYLDVFGWLHMNAHLGQKIVAYFYPGLQ